jgi:hypothetical protein
VQDLVLIPALLPQSVSHYQWIKDGSFDDATNTLTLQTRNDERYVFDVRTGEVIEGRLPPQRAANWPWIMLAVVVCSGIGIVVWRRRKLIMRDTIQAA